VPSSTHRTRTILPDTRREPLLSRARREPEAFAEFYAAHRHHVQGFFARRTLDPDTAVDLMCTVRQENHKGVA
jgi:hypothetical protein